MRIDSGWEVASAAPEKEPRGWRVARVPAWSPASGPDLDAFEWCFRTHFDASPVREDEEAVLRLGGIATLSEVTLNGELILESSSMFAAHEIDVGGLLRERNDLSIRCRALAPLLEQPRKPRARWRTRVATGNLRFFRTAILGRAPGFAPGPAPVGPWRPVTLERRTGIVIDSFALRPRLEGGDGVLGVRASLRVVGGGPPPATIGVELTGPSGAHRALLRDGAAELRVPDAARWWPHTHGEPALHEVRLLAGGEPIGEVRRVGFRAIAPGPGPDHDVEEDGLRLHVNGVPVFARGAVWTPMEPGEVLPTLRTARDAGMNLIRVAGTATYETAAFHDACDALGLLVWQDFMFANFDYPIGDEAFRRTVAAEARQEMAGLAGRPSLAVVCGGSEVEQQAAMFGVDPAAGRGELFGELLPRLVAESGADAIYVPSAPCGGDVPFRTDRGVANYFGVGGYRQPLEDVRRAGVRFASECLALANVSDETRLGPREGVMRDTGAEWDFADVRDFYLDLLYGLGPSSPRYESLSAEVSGEVMAAVFGEWRRAASPCGGGIVLWLRDLAPGAGWGVVDSSGAPKAALGHLRRILSPVAVWMTDEGLNGVAVHAANDHPAPLAARLRVTLYRDFEHQVDEAEEDLHIGPHTGIERGVEAMLGRWVDASYAYRFGPPGHDLVVASLEAEGLLLSQAVLFPAGRPAIAESGDSLGLTATAAEQADGVEVVVHTRRFAQGVRIAAAGFLPADDAFPIEPGSARVVRMRPREADSTWSGATITAANLKGKVLI